MLSPSWLVLIANLPQKPSSLRVKVWRKLRAMGAVALKKSVYILPFSPGAFEQFQWLSQDVQKEGGEATLFKVDQLENIKPAEIVRRFQEARNLDYRQIADAYRRIARGLARSPRRRSVSRRDDELTRLAREVERVREIDFFEASGYEEVKRLRETIEMRLYPRDDAAGELASRGTLSPDAFKGRLWVTRPRPHIDRIGSAWLIKRFIDPGARFEFLPPEDFPTDSVPFDTLGAEFGHHGDDCTFETMVKRFGLRDGRLLQIAEIVHEVDLRDQKFRRDEARGVDLAIRGLLAMFKGDQDTLAHGMTLFESLYTAIGEAK